MWYNRVVRITVFPLPEADGRVGVEATAEDGALRVLAVFAPADEEPLVDAVRTAFAEARRMRSGLVVPDEATTLLVPSSG